MVFRIVVLLVSVFAAVCYGNSFKFSDCPKVKVMKEFQMSEFVGEWFVVARFNPWSSCVKLDIEKTPEGIFTVHESTRVLGFNFGSEGRERRPRKINIVSNDTDAVFKVQRFSGSHGLRTFGVVDTDYEKFAIVWNCDRVIAGSVQNLDILTRGPAIEAEDLKEYATIAQKAGVDLRPLGKVDHSRCIKKEQEVEESELRKDVLNNMFVE